MRSFLCVLLLAAACHHSSPSSTPPTNGAGVTDGAGSAAGSASTGSGAATCPPPKESDVICAQVVTYVRTPEGACCMYGAPCLVPVAGQQYSDEKCTTPMGGAGAQ